ncbi:glycoside hydrolase family 26 protein [Lutibacter aestuarii]|uniref:Mannan endo-1,4-beta-mannosidase n=1 Tax=Lutibacter aestuarii TaxID=861111 RepID=A0ABW2ZA86_9FLAO
MKKNVRINLCKLIVFSGFIIVFMSCVESKKEEITSLNSIVDKFNTVRGKGILFGHQDDLAYGIGWKYIEGESDVKRVAGDYPALFGWELGGLELDHIVNLDSVPFDRMRNLSIKAHNLGGINTFSWHPYSVIDSTSSWTNDAEVVKHIILGGAHHKAFIKQLDKVATFFKSLKTDNGKKIPFIFRPWHEMDGNWFWWGREQCTTSEFKELFKLTINYLRETHGLENMLIAYSPDNHWETLEEYYSWYPGDEYVDIMAMDNYYGLNKENGEKEAIRKLHIIIKEAKLKDKFSALTETGLENVTNNKWFTNKLGSVLKDSIITKELSYVMIWRNDERVHFFFPYPGHPAASDAKTFLDKPEILLLNDFLRVQKK